MVLVLGADFFESFLPVLSIALTFVEDDFLDTFGFFIGLFEHKFLDHNKILRIFSDSAYWIYLIHLPIVSFITFFMFRFNFAIEFKFILSILLTSIISYLSYKYLIRSSYIGVLLNGKKLETPNAEDFLKKSLLD